MYIIVCLLLFYSFSGILVFFIIFGSKTLPRTFLQDLASCEFGSGVLCFKW
jgi:hypothetical protein